ncbi:DUF3164 family protein [Flavobacterium olei]|uniref:DUF3164 family protein n=1 Tax=Flavobacterium olei TaxID=1886782 RepID=UPI00321A3615
MNTSITNIPAIDLSQFSAQQLKEALSQIESKKTEERETYKKLVAETIPKALSKLQKTSEMIRNVKTETFQLFETILDLKNQVYGFKEKQMSHTFSNDNEEITIGYRINEGWDDTVTIGIEKVQNFISSLSTSKETASLVKIVFNLLKKDAKGNLKGSRVLELQKLTKEFNNAEFSDGVEIIASSFRPIRSSWFIEASTINKNGTRTSIPLSMSSVDFLHGYAFNFFNQQNQHTNAA